jgi:hypothetical protein
MPEPNSPSTTRVTGELTPFKGVLLERPSRLSTSRSRLASAPDSLRELQTRLWRSPFSEMWDSAAVGSRMTAIPFLGVGRPSMDISVRSSVMAIGPERSKSEPARWPPANARPTTKLGARTKAQSRPFSPLGRFLSRPGRIESPSIILSTKLQGPCKSQPAPRTRELLQALY